MHLILTLILLSSFLYAKAPDFSIIIDEPFNNALVDVTEDYDRSISAVGYIKKYKNNQAKEETTYRNAFDYLASVSNTYGSQIHLVKVDNQADITLRKSIDLPNFNEAVSIAKTPQNGYFVGGHTLDGSLLIIKVSSSGEKIFHKTFGTANQDKMSKMILLRDGGVLAIGSSTASRSPNDNLFDSGLGLSDIYMARFTSNGEMLWSKKYGTLSDDIGIDAAEADDGSIMLLAQTNSEKSKNATILRITQNGDKIWLKEYKNEKNTTPHKILKLRDGSFALSLSQEDDLGKEQVRLLKVDLQKNILLDKMVQTTYATILKDIKEYSDGKIIGVGSVQDNYNTDGVAMLFDSKFSMLTQEHYGSAAHDSFNALSILHNSQVGVVGVYTNKESQETNMWIVKLNKDLTMVKIAVKAETKKEIKSAKPTNFYADLYALLKQEIEAKKIELKEDLSIHLIDATLYFKVGEYTLTNEQKEFLQKLSNKLLPFLYKNREFIKTLEISGHTSSEWGTSDFSQRYLKNEKLSMNRSFSTLSYIFNNHDGTTQKWLAEVIKGSGVNFSKKVIYNENEDKEKSRRVTFKIILK
ncbi:MAG: OmpA family protein [Sulfurimonas sp.]|nr:OmpA family protein [Sulfurimonas sp.]